MRVALCQINTTLGAFDANIARILEFLKVAGEQNTELAIFPELCISSYPPLDLLDRPEFLKANEEALKKLEATLNTIPNCPKTIVLGSIVPNKKPVGRAIHNAALVFNGGKLVHVQPKRLLPTYDVFDESRYFEPAQTTEVWSSKLFGKVGLSVCEDAWFESQHMGTLAGRKMYEAEDPAIALKGSDLIINISASPFEMNKRLRRQELISGFVSRASCPTIYVNQVGANDEILFDGSSAVFSASGKVIFEMPSFIEAIGILDLNLHGDACVSNTSIWRLKSEVKSKWEKIDGQARITQDETELVHKALVVGIRDYFSKTGFQKAVLGLSGGIDSAVIAALATEALGARNVLGVSLPSQYSSSHSLTDAEELAKNLGIEYHVHSIKFVFAAIQMELKATAGSGDLEELATQNIQARLRGLMLMAIANRRNALLLTTGNKSELATGYCTIYGDMAGALAPLGDVYKTRVYGLAKQINLSKKIIPESTLTKPPSAELRPNQTDQDTLPPYELLDLILENYFEGLEDAQTIAKHANCDFKLVESMIRLIRHSEFKRRQAAPILKVTSKAFGLGRRVPVAKAF